ncbi:MAG: hypothetical protein AAB839_00010 [Patescibacteria group bacterium]
MLLLVTFRFPSTLDADDLLTRLQGGMRPLGWQIEGTPTLHTPDPEGVEVKFALRPMNPGQTMGLDRSTLMFLCAGGPGLLQQVLPQSH